MSDVYTPRYALFLQNSPAPAINLTHAHKMATAPSPASKQGSPVMQAFLDGLERFAVHMIQRR